MAVQASFPAHSHLGLGDRDILDVEAVDMGWGGLRPGFGFGSWVRIP